MQFAAKLLLSVVLIVVATQVGRRVPTLSGLIATMPLASLIVLLWLYSDHPGDFAVMTRYAKGALWGIGPSILFFVVAYLCFRSHLRLAVTLPASFGAWFLGAAVHQWLLRG